MRCKACDKIMEESEIIWKEEEGEHEELCSKCLKIINKFEEESDEEFDLTTIIGELDLEELIATQLLDE